MNIQQPDFGGVNDFPVGWREISADKFARAMTLYSWERSEYRQMRSKENPTQTVVCGRLFFFHNYTGVAVVFRHRYDNTCGKYVDVGEFYAFGCDHEMEHTPWNSDTMGVQYNCMNAYTCKKCGYTVVYDSSD